MANAPVPRFDPERLREERHDVDLGTDTVERGPNVDAGDASTALQQDEPTAGLTVADMRRGPEAPAG